MPCTGARESGCCQMDHHLRVPGDRKRYVTNRILVRLTEGHP